MGVYIVIKQELPSGKIRIASRHVSFSEEYDILGPTMKPGTVTELVVMLAKSNRDAITKFREQLKEDAPPGPII